MRFLQDVVVRGDTATTAVVQDNVFEDDVVGGDEDAVNNVFEILGTIGGTLIAVSFRSLSLSLSLSLCVCVVGFFLSGGGVVSHVYRCGGGGGGGGPVETHFTDTVAPVIAVCKRK